MEKIVQLSEIAKDTLNGLSANPKYLLPKYFYDDRGSQIFQNIMNMPEYYLTDCEVEIFETGKQQITKAFCNSNSCFELIELGSGDGLKTKILLKQLMTDERDFKFIPIDISLKANEELVYDLNTELPGLKVEEKTGDYFHIMRELGTVSSMKKIILFLGSNIGNFSNEETSSFLTNLAELTRTDDQVLIGFDLKKSPEILMQAYDDPHGHTRQFNLNLLTRLNRELGADFNLTKFEHYTSYNPISGEVKSYLVSKTKQTVLAAALEQSFHFEQWEAIFMERSRKYDLPEIEKLAALNGFKVKQHFFDTRKYFVDSLWIRD